MVVNVNVKQIQVAGTLDQVSKDLTNCQFLNHWLVKTLIGMDRQIRKRWRWRRTWREGKTGGQEDEEERKTKWSKRDKENRGREKLKGSFGRRMVCSETAVEYVCEDVGLVCVQPFEQFE